MKKGMRGKKEGKKEILKTMIVREGNKKEKKGREEQKLKIKGMKGKKR